MSNILLDIRGLNYPFLTGINTVTLHILRELCHKNQLLKHHNFSAFGVSAAKSTSLKREFIWLQKLLSNSENGFENADQIRLKQVVFLAKFYLNLPEVSWDKFETVYQPQPKPIPKLGKNQKFITTFHDLSSIKNLNQPSLKHFIQENKLAYQKLADQASTIVTCSYATAYDLVRTLQVPENKIRVIYQALPNWKDLKQDAKVQNSIDNAQNSTPPKIKNTKSFTHNPISLAAKPSDIYLNEIAQKPYFLALSAFEYRKNYHNLILAWHFLKKSEPSIYENFNLIIAGNKVDQKYYKYLENLIQKLDLKHIYMVCDVSSETKENLLENCQAVVYTSLYEGFGFPILEAQKYGKAVLTSNVSAMPEIASNGALLVSPLDSYQICEGLVILARDEIYRKSLSQNGRENLRRFSWQEYNLALNGLFD